MVGSEFDAELWYFWGLKLSTCELSSPCHAIVAGSESWRSLCSNGVALFDNTLVVSDAFRNITMRRTPALESAA